MQVYGTFKNKKTWEQGEFTQMAPFAEKVILLFVNSFQQCFQVSRYFQERKYFQAHRFGCAHSFGALTLPEEHTASGPLGPGDSTWSAFTGSPSVLV